MGSSSASILIVSPVRNEAAHIERVVRAVAAQELTPARWIVIDDGSTDNTLEILRRLESEVPFMRVHEASHKRADAVVRDRLAMAAAPRTFNAGLVHDRWQDYDYVMKLDGDIELPPDYFRVLLGRFAAEPALGIAGCVLIEPTADGGTRTIRIARQHVHGAVKCYSRACFDAIGGVQERLGWDTIDETYARMRGYLTRSFEDMISVHHRPIGSADGVLRGHARHGACAYIAHYPPEFVALRAAKVATRSPRGISGAAFFYGYLRAAWLHIEQVPDPQYRRFTRRELRERIARGVLPSTVAVRLRRSPQG